MEDSHFGSYFSKGLKPPTSSGSEKIDTKPQESFFFVRLLLGKWVLFELPQFAFQVL